MTQLQTHQPFNRRRHLSVPQFTRSNHRFQGSRESYKINLEIQQILYSLSKLDETYSVLSDDLKEVNQVLFEGGEIPAVADHNGDPLTTPGIEGMIGRLKTLQHRVSNLSETAEALGRFTEVFQSRY